MTIRIKRQGGLLLFCLFLFMELNIYILIFLMLKTKFNGLEAGNPVKWFFRNMQFRLDFSNRCKLKFLIL